MFDFTQSDGATDEWAERSNYWLHSIRKHTPKRKRRERQSVSLILSGHGISISVERATLRIADGNTYYPSEKSTYRFFKGDLQLPGRIILLGGSGNITLDALDWLSTQNTELIRLNWDGNPILSLRSGKAAVNPEKLIWQYDMQKDEAKRLEFAIPLIAAKAEATLQNLIELLPDGHSRTKAIATAKSVIETLNTRSPETIGQLLAEEGRVAAGYFFAWRALKIQWNAEKKHPIHEEWRQFFSRSALNTDIRIKNFRATHPINAMLNYAYGLLEAHVRIGVISDGYDPARGILHSHADPGRHSFVHDLMEPMRPIADQAVLKLVQQETFSGADFILQDDGVCRLNPNLARRLVHEVGLSMNAYADGR